MPPRTAKVVLPEFDAIDGVIQEDLEQDAEGLGELLGELRGVTTQDSEVLVYKSVERGGKWAYIKTLTPPIETRGLFEDLRIEWGGGEYFFRVRSKGKIVTTKRAMIAGDPNPKKKEERDDSIGELVPLLMSTQQKSSTDMMQMMTMMMSQQQASAAANQQMMMGMMTALIPAMMGGKESMSSIIGAMAQMQAANAPKSDEDPMEKTVKLMTLMKAFMGEGGGGGDGDDFMTTALKSLGPALAGAVANGQQREAAAPPQIAARPPAQFQPPMISGPISPPPSFQAPPLPVTPIALSPEDFSVPPPSPATEPAYKSDPVLSVIAADLLFMAEREYDVEDAAEILLDRLDKQGVPENDIIALAVRFGTSPDVVTDLYNAGIDLIAHRDWVVALVPALVSAYAGSDEDGHSEGDAGGTGDAVDHGEAGENG